MDAMDGGNFSELKEAGIVSEFKVAGLGDVNRCIKYTPPDLTKPGPFGMVILESSLKTLC